MSEVLPFIDKRKVEGSFRPYDVDPQLLWTDEFIRSPKFCFTREWKALRYDALDFYGPQCAKCESIDRPCVDHIWSRKRAPALSLALINTQILCEPCNCAKGNWDDGQDWRGWPDYLRWKKLFSETPACFVLDTEWLFPHIGLRMLNDLRLDFPERFADLRRELVQ